MDQRINQIIYWSNNILIKELIDLMMIGLKNWLINESKDLLTNCKSNDDGWINRVVRKKGRVDGEGVRIDEEGVRMKEVFQIELWIKDDKPEMINNFF